MDTDNTMGIARGKFGGLAEGGKREKKWGTTVIAQTIMYNKK